MHLFWKISVKTTLTLVFGMSIAREIQALPTTFHTINTHAAFSVDNRISGFVERKVLAQIRNNTDSDNHQQKEYKLQKQGQQRRKIHPKLAHKLQDILNKDVKELNVTGVTVAIITPQGIWEGASGIANLQTNKPMRPRNILGMGSTNKPYMSATVLKVAESGKLSLDDTLEQWLPEIATNIPGSINITIRQLLNGKGGIPNFTDDEKFLVDSLGDPNRQRSPKELIAYIYDEPRFQGENCSPIWCYTNTGNILAGIIVEKATGSRLANVMRREVFKPLRLRQTFFRPNERVLGKLARGYQDIFTADGSLGQDGIPEDLTDIDPAIFSFTVPVHASALDTARFFDGLFRGKLLKPESLEEMLTFVDTGLDLDFGLGITRRNTQWGKAFSYAGTSTAYRSQMYYFPELRITIVALGNHSYEIENPEKNSYMRTSIVPNILNTFFNG